MSNKTFLKRAAIYFIMLCVTSTFLFAGIKSQETGVEIAMFTCGLATLVASAMYADKKLG